MLSQVGQEMTKKSGPQFPEEGQVQNNAGGYVWEVNDMMRLRRFLILGSEGGTYYIQEKPLTLENAKTVAKLIAEEKGEDVLKEVVTISTEGRAAKQNPTLFCLAMCAKFTPETPTKPGYIDRLRAATYEALPKVCRIPTHLFLFVEYCESLSGDKTGWGRAHRRAISNWYLSRDPKSLAFTVTKYPQREGWSHRDLLRLAHPVPAKKKDVPDDVVKEYDDIFHFVTQGYDAMISKQKKRKAPEDGDSGDAKAKKSDPEDLKPSMKFLQGLQDLKSTDNASSAAWLVKEHGLVREHVPTGLLNELEMWEALAKDMPFTAMVRNLNKMTHVKLLTEDNEETMKIFERLHDEAALKKAKIHPYTVLVALYTYKAGKGDKGKLEWTPIPKIVEALDNAFYLSFKNVPPTGKRMLLALDVSGSMSFAKIMGSSLTPRVASAALILHALRSEPEKNVDVVAFQTDLIGLPFKKDWTLDRVLSHVENMSFGGTDCAQPMLFALKKRRPYDLFVVYTDSETWAGNVQPAEALRKYRKQMKIPEAKLIVIGMTSNGFSIADPNDPGMMDIVGFDSAAPEIMRNFTLGLL